MFARKDQREIKPMPLNITSLMDIMTIILIFLIVSFESQESEVSPPKDFKIPASSSQRPIKLAVKVSVGKEEIRVEDKVIVKMPGGKLRPSDLDSDKHIKALLKEMKKQKAKLTSGTVKLSPKKGGDDEDEEAGEIVYFEAATGTRYEIIDRVLKTSAAAGFVKFRLAVFKKL